MTLLSIVLPCYNPVENWHSNVLKNYKEIKEKLGFSPEVVIVNDGSNKSIHPDALSFLISNIEDLIFLDCKINQGKGAALRHGISNAKGQFIIYTDIDFPYENNSIAGIWEELEKGYDIVIGIKDENYYKHVPAARVYISKILRYLSRLTLNIPVTDTQCGLKGFNQKGRNIFLQTSINRYLCDLEFVYKSFRQKEPVKITTQQIKLREGIAFSSMNFRILIPELFNFLKILVKAKSHEI